MAAEKTLNTDAVIIGAGLVGLTAAIALSQLGKKVVLTDARPRQSFTADWQADATQWDARIYALTNETVAWLSEIGVWEHVPASRVHPINAMHLWAPTASHSAPSLQLDAEDAHLAQMGWIVESQALIHACWQVLATLEVTVLDDAPAHSLQQLAHSVRLSLPAYEIEAKLLIGADGANSWVRQQCNIDTRNVDFAQTALVTNYLAEHPHAGIARQWFGAHETLALLPMPQQLVSLVWALPTPDAALKKSVTPEALADAVAQRCGHVLGTLRPYGPVLSFPLRQQTATDMALPHVLLLGDAAHQVHPMAGQGVNLGFQDVQALCHEVKQLPALRPIGEASFLRRVMRRRQTDLLKMHGLTRGLDTLFARPEAIWAHAALLGLRGVENSAMLKRFLIRTATQG